MSEAEEHWGFYLCRVDDAPASIRLDLSLEHRAPLANADTLYWIRIGMLDPDGHGMGSLAEAQSTDAATDPLTDRAVAYGLRYVGCLRNHGTWQLVFYGPTDRVETLRALATSALASRRIDVGSKPDPEWSYYREFLLPDAERRQWIENRRLVEVLEQHGDRADVARRVDHWAYFPTAAARAAFIAAAERDGFIAQHPLDAAGDGGEFGAQVYRTDSVPLEHIHGVVMRLLGLAEQNGGRYDGWETSVEGPEAPAG